MLYKTQSDDQYMINFKKVKDLVKIFELVELIFDFHFTFILYFAYFTFTINICIVILDVQHDTTIPYCSSPYQHDSPH